MTRSLWFLGVGGCLLGWEPEGGGDSGGGDSDVADTDTGVLDTDLPDLPCVLPSDQEPCAVFDERIVAIGGTLVPEFRSDVGIMDVYVYVLGDDTNILWHGWTDDGQSSQCSFVYGETPPGVSEGGPEALLTAGVTYEVKFDSHCVGGIEGLSSRYATFTASP